MRSSPAWIWGPLGVAAVLAGCGFARTGAVGDGAVGGGDGSLPVDGDGGSGPDARPLDSDGDGVVDGDDNCPQVPNPLQYDYDADGEGDACDPCPAISSIAVPSSDTDTDGDHIGDACDPRPGTVDTRVAFYDFTDPTAIAGWGSSGPAQWSLGSGALVVSAPGAAPSFLTVALPGGATLAHPDLDTVFVPDAVIAGGVSALAVCVAETNCCGVYDSAADTAADGVPYAYDGGVVVSVWSVPYLANAVEQRLQDGSDGKVDCAMASAGSGASPSLGAAVVATNSVELFAQGVSGRFLYLFVIDEAP